MPLEPGALPPMYTELSSFYPLLDELADHEAECREWLAEFERAAGRAPETLLELGAGAGHNGHYLARNCRCTLVDLSPAMLELSRVINPTCEHVAGDMRSVRLGRRFDAVLIHDAIVYMTSEADLLAAMITAFEHTEPGGSAIFAPDFVREGFKEGSDDHEGEDGQRAFRCLEWSWDPDPSDDTYRVDYAWLLREGDRLTHRHETHIEGLFSRETWLDSIRAAGFEPHVFERELAPEDRSAGYTLEVFRGRRPIETG